MKNNRKVLSVALAGALAFGSMGAAFAAAPAMDTKTDKNIQEAVERLASFGIVNGMEDGKYHEEMKVTREQFAKLLVEALGLGNAANAATGTTKFSDVEGSRWSAGYVNVAVGQGLLKGYPDGTFKPAAEVSYAEAVTMLVRALGYKDEFLSGAWPGNFVAKAAESGITDGAKFTDVAGKADRGMVALLVDNTLDSNVVKVDSYENGTAKYKESDKSLLEDKLKITEYKNIRLVGNERIKASLNSDEAEFKSTKDNGVFVKDTDFDKDEVEKVDTIKGLNTDELMGLKVKVYVNDDDKVVFMQRDGSETAAIDVVKSVDAGNKEVTLLNLDDTYKAEGTAYVTGKDSTKVLTGDAYSKLEKGMMGKFIIENNEVVFADVLTGNIANGLVVKTVNADTAEINGILGTDDSETVNLKDDFDKYIIKDSNGKSLELKDIKANNVVYVSKTQIDGDDYAVVTVVQNNEVKGKLTKVKSDKVEIGGKSYDLTANYADDTMGATFSANKDKDIYTYSVDDKKLEDMSDKDVVAITDMAGRIIHITADVKTTSEDMYGILVKKYTESESVKVYIPSQDKEVTYKLEDDADLAAANVGDLIKFSLNKNGEIAEGEINKDVTVKDLTIAASSKLGKNSITTTGTNAGNYSVGSSTILIAEEDATAGVNVDELAPVKWDDIKEDTVGASNISAKAIIDAKGEIEAIFFLDNGIASSSNDEQAGYVIDSWKQGEDKIVKVELFDGGVKEFKLDAGTATIENAYVVKVKSNGKLELVSKDAGATTDFTIVSGTVYAKDGDYIQLVANGTFYKVSDKTVIYDEDTKKKISNITKGTQIDIIVEDGKDARVIEIQ